jgi:hypothetical protein
MVERNVSYKAPVEAVADAVPERLPQVAAAVATGALTALLLGATPLLAWTNELPIGPVSDFVLYLAQGWQNTAEALHLTVYADMIRYLLRSFEGMR